MMAPDPMRSATDIGGAEDTSLAMPSDRSLCTGHQRVLNQVHSIKRGRSKYNKNGTTSPTSPPAQTFKTSEFGTSKFKGASTYRRSNSTMSAGNRAKSRNLTTKITRGRYFSSNVEPQVSTSAWSQSPNGLKPSRSDPGFVPVPNFSPAPSMKVKGQAISRQNTLHTQGVRESRSMINGLTLFESQLRNVQSPSGHSQTDGKLDSVRTSKIEQTSMGNSAVSMSEITMPKAVELLSELDENSQQCGASYIQHICYNNESAKKEVLKLQGIPRLVKILESENPSVTQAASGALRNLVFKNIHNKKKVHECGGIAKVLNLLKNTECTETKKQLTGLLWNLSSADDLKQELMQTALPFLTKNVVVPFTTWSENGDDNHVDPTVFHHATGCLRNLSSGKQKDRQEMRECDQLINSLMKYVLSCVAEDKPDDMSVENCVCILQNLTFQIWQECPEMSDKYVSSRSRQSESKKSPTVGCFSPRSSKAENKIYSSEPKGVKEGSKGVEWLCDQKAIDAYLELMTLSKNDTILEACCGALQNLTANKEHATISEDLFEKFKFQVGLPSLMRSHNIAVQKGALSLLDNMARKSSLQLKMARQTLPQLSKVLFSDTWNDKGYDENIATASTTIHRLLLVEHESSKKAITKDLVFRLIDMSKKEPEDKATTAASKLLYNLWSDKFLHSITKKLKIGKAYFVNPKTIKAADPEKFIT
ncbi:plakophilin-1 [Girardinichthys multiradiatus]|uniref:plakophilin-1 n=1 Tax=Girardinichthys multiradiatus TaxID=208333 RepID=UPI001FADFEB8|nr:plakophilin-1 [Girardinichthys multiradiatus]